MRLRWLLPLGVGLSACSDGVTPPPPPPPPPVARQFLGDFPNPLFATSPPADSLRLFVVLRGGMIRVLRRDTLLTTAFLDVRTKISSVAENGMFSMAFHPQYATNGRFYVFFTDLNGDIRVVRYNVSAADPNVADEASADTVLKVPHPISGYSLPFANHHGGQLAFGPDGKLYVSLGDGGCCGDPQRNGQKKHTLNGKLLRLDVDGASGYSIPPDNPFATDTSGDPEIWAYGFRNPWRFSFDKLTGDLYIGDVGQDLWEEVDVAAAGTGKGANYGWSILEGMHCYPSGTCNSTGLTFPLIEYGHVNGLCSVTGGYVYRGTRVAVLTGHYLYADYCTGFVGSFRYVAGAATDPRNWTVLLSPGALIVSFGEDARGDVYMMTYGGGLYRIVEGP